MNSARLQLRRWLLQRRDFDEPFRSFLNSDPVRARTRFRDVDFVALDIETTGLDPSTAEILSVGWVLVRKGVVDLGSAETYLVRPGGDVGSSAAVHGLTDTIVEAGHDCASVVDRIVSTLAGRVLLVHHAGLDKALLDRLCRERFGASLPVPVVDTLALEIRRRKRRDLVNERRALRLGELRTAYCLPRYAAHDCLIDAIATAELLIAMVAHNAGEDATRLRDLC